jgi:predicted HAD superfamily Cof-like phosphohydrolase
MSFIEGEAALVHEFMQKCGHPPRPHPASLDGCSERQHRFFIDNAAGEIEELREAYEAGDLAEVAKEACDVIYFLLHYLLMLGVDYHAVFREVHRSNMSKFNPETGEVYRDEAGRVTKGPHFSPADIASIVYRTKSSA